MTTSEFELFCDVCNKLFISDVSWKTYCKKCYAKKMKAEQGEPSQQESKVIYQNKPIPLDMVNRLIRLCHPDFHNNSEASNTATAWLIDQRKLAKDAGQ